MTRCFQHKLRAYPRKLLRIVNSTLVCGAFVQEITYTAQVPRKLNLGHVQQRHLHHLRQSNMSTPHVTKVLPVQEGFRNMPLKTNQPWRTTIDIDNVTVPETTKGSMYMSSLRTKYG